MKEREADLNTEEGSAVSKTRVVVTSSSADQDDLCSAVSALAISDSETTTKSSREGETPEWMDEVFSDLKKD